jgi:hypothetical protein
MLRTALLLGVCLTLLGGAPVALAGSQPSASMVAPAGCASAVYSWVNLRKAAVAHIEIRPNGVLLATVHSGRVGASGSFTLPSSVAFVSGQHYTLLGYVTDSSGRSVAQSGAAWWGFC